MYKLLAIQKECFIVNNSNNLHNFSIGMCKNRVDLSGRHRSGYSVSLCLAVPPADLTYYMVCSGADDNYPNQTLKLVQMHLFERMCQLATVLSPEPLLQTPDIFFLSHTTILFKAFEKTKLFAWHTTDHTTVPLSCLQEFLSYLVNYNLS